MPQLGRSMTKAEVIAFFVCITVFLSLTFWGIASIGEAEKTKGPCKPRIITYHPLIMVCDFDIDGGVVDGGSK